MNPGVLRWSLALVLIGVTVFVAGTAIRELKLDRVMKISIVAMARPAPLTTL